MDGKVPINGSFDVIDGRLSLRKTPTRCTVTWESRDCNSWEELDWDYEHLPVIGVYTGTKRFGMSVPSSEPAAHIVAYMDRFRGKNKTVDHMLELYECGGVVDAASMVGWPKLYF